MSPLIDPQPIERETAPVFSAAPLPDALVAAPKERSLDLYADSELRLRHERTERAIRRAEADLA